MNAVGIQDLLSASLLTEGGPEDVELQTVVEAIAGGRQRLSRQVEVAVAVEQLLERGLVRRETSEGTERLSLTEEGEARAAETVERLSEREIELVEGGTRREVTVAEAADELGRSPVEVAADCSADGVYYREDRVDEDDIVGREAEQQRFEAVLDQVGGSGDGEVVRLVGPGGNGKTELANALLARTSDDVETVQTTSREAESEPFQPLGDLFTQLGVESPIEAAEFEVDDADTFEAQQTGLFTDITRALTPESGVRVLVFDDVNRADRATWEYLAFLSERLADRPLVVVLAHRPGTLPEEAPVHSEADFGETLIELTGLDGEATRQLIQQVVGRRSVPDAFVDAVQERTGGTPLFVETTVKTLLETNQIDPQIGRYPTDSREFDLPDEVTETIQRQTAVLEPDVREVLEWVAVAGGYVPVSLVAEAADDTPERIRTVLDTVTGTGLLDQETRASERVVTFRNEVFGDALADRLDGAERERRHGRIASLLANRLGDGAGAERAMADQAATIAYHYERGGDLANAIEWYETAADRATDVYAHETAVDYYYRVLELARQAEDAETVLATNEELVEIYLVTGEYDQAEKHIQFVQERIDRDDSRRSQHLAWLRGRVHNAQGEFEAAIEVVTAALDGEASVEQCRLFDVLTRSHFGLGDFERMRDVAQRQRDLAEAIDEPALEAGAIKELGTVAVMRGAYDEAREYYTESLTIAQAFGDRMLEQASQHNLGGVAHQQGRYDEARESFEESLAICEEIGYRKGVALTRNSIGSSVSRCGLFEQARENLDEALTITREIGHRHGEVISRSNLGQTAHRQGRVETAREQFEEGLAIAREIRDPRGQMMHLNPLGKLAYRHGDDDRAREYYERALELAEKHDLKDKKAETHSGLCALARRAGDYDRAGDQFDQALELSEAVGDPFWSGRVRLEGARLALAREDIPTARQRAESAGGTFEEIGASYWLGRSRQVLGAIERADGDADAAREQFRVAVETFEEVGAPLDALEALDALVDCCRAQDDDGAGERWSRRAGEILAEAPAPVADEHGQ